jgi:hypothetical protein
VQEFVKPNANSWRMKLSVSEKLTDPCYFLAGIEEFFSRLLKDHQWRNPFARGVDYLGPSIEVASEEVSRNTIGRAALPR